MTSEYQIEVNKNHTDDRWDTFLKSTPGGHHVQTSLWGEVKAALGWRVLRILVKETHHILAGSQLLLKSYPLIGSVAYISKGPILASLNDSLLDILVKEILRVSQASHVQLLVVQPPNNDKLIADNLPSYQFAPSLLELAPCASILVDLSPSVDSIFGRMKRQTRQNIRRSSREGIITREGNQEDLHHFYNLYQTTSQRQNFIPYPLDYFVRMWEIFTQRGEISLIMAEFEGDPVSALLLIPFQDTVIAKILGWSGQHSNRRPNDAVFWASIQWSKANGYRWFDFEGIDIETARTVMSGSELLEEMKHSPDFIKLGYGGQVVLYPMAFERLPNPILRWSYKKVSPKIGDTSPGSRLLEFLRKR